jgi:N-acetyl-1-D-myo-inositol-2-amino-2-deoxy-alpha-D-glucopyranoside deacetylase
MEKKKPRLVAIFAHPDDEAFGPSGTLALYAKTHDVYIICATRGEAGKNHDVESQHKTIGDIREAELRASAKIIGTKEVIMLGFEDGMLSNNLYHEIADKILKHLEELRPEILMTYELHGISGHIDHVVMAMVSSYLFDRTTYTKKLMYHCLDVKEQESIGDYFIFVPPGYTAEEINEKVDVSSVWDLKVKAIKTHVSQAKDGNSILEEMKDLPQIENFLIKEK